ncbi:MAG: hypothetical protein NZ473_00735 [Candidatus Kapabacteria bacterium]|nr:hypothetical protein [Candidatus Kapabacteria bacterium]
MSATLQLYSFILALAHTVARHIPGTRCKAHARRLWVHHLRELQGLHCSTGTPRLWVHAASAGEFEHIRPVLELLRERLPGLSVVLSFFSPSGLAAHKTTPLADVIVLLPPDLPTTVHSFLNAVHPDVAVFIRYELWPGYLTALRQRGIPTVLMAATFPRSHLWTLPGPRTLLRKTLRCFRLIMALNSREAVAFQRFVPDVPTVSIPDPRYDRIWAVVHQQTDLHLPDASHTSERFRIVAGSTWNADHRLLRQAIPRLPEALRARLTLVIVPHEPTPEAVDSLLRLFPQAYCWSRIQPNTSLAEDRAAPLVVIVDRLGLLLQLYRIGDAAYVGGGFGRCVHNLAEPAAYGLPLACGPAVAASPDAGKLLSAGALTIVRTADELAQWLETMSTSPAHREHRGAAARAVIEHQLGGAENVATTLATLLHSRYSKVQQIS